MRGLNSLGRFVPKGSQWKQTFQSWSWNQEEKNAFSKAIAKFNFQAFPKRINVLKPLFKNTLAFFLSLPVSLVLYLSLYLYLPLYSSSSSFSSSSSSLFFIFLFLCLFLLLFLFLSFSFSLSLPISLITPLIKNNWEDQQRYWGILKSHPRYTLHSIGKINRGIREY